MFTAAERSQLTDQLTAAARNDPRITAAALVGSVAADRQDEWSDIDLALRIAPASDPGEVAASWTAALYESHRAVAHVDLWSGPTLYRVFLLGNSLQVDLSLWPDDEFSARGGPFRLIFGETNDPPTAGIRSPTSEIGMAWLHALHARSSIARGRALQSVYMLNGMREHVISLACIRHGVAPDQGRGVDQLPHPLKQQITSTLVGDPGIDELLQSFSLITNLLAAEIEAVDPSLAKGLRPVLRELVRTAAPPRETTRVTKAGY